ncbi:MAG: hypothetical protein H7Z19_17830, partial [Chitinophagaceae bacterium]|nr:hypothetical protein [Rubrivivax sp.]
MQDSLVGQFTVRTQLLGIAPRIQDDFSLLHLRGLAAQLLSMPAAPVLRYGDESFPPIAEQPYPLTPPAYGFYWFRPSSDATPPRWHAERLPVQDLAMLVLFDGWNSFFRSPVVPWRIAMDEKTRSQLERELLPGF